MFSTLLQSKSKEPVKDKQLWLSFEIEYSPIKQVEIGFAQKLRFFNDYSELAQYITDIGAYYKCSKLFKIGLFYRYRMFPNIDYHRNEVYSNLINKLKFGKWTLQNRLRLHIKFRQEKETINYLRYRLTIKYSLFHILHPYASAEIYYRFLYDKGDRLSRGRYRCGFEIPVAKSHTIDLFYMFETAYNVKRSVYSHILGLYYTFEF